MAHEGNWQAVNGVLLLGEESKARPEVFFPNSKTLTACLYFSRMNAVSRALR